MDSVDGSKEQGKVNEDSDPRRCVECKRRHPETVEEELVMGQPGSPCTDILYPDLEHDGDMKPVEPVVWFLRHRRYPAEDGVFQGGEVWRFDPPRLEWKDNLLCFSCFDRCREEGKVIKIEGLCGGCCSKEHGGIGCEICGTRYRCMGMSKTQAVDCASHLFRRIGESGTESWWLLGSYGSDFDTTLFQFELPIHAEVKEADPVCDTCIRRFLAEKWMKPVEGSYPFGAEWAACDQPLPR